jgi:cytochrome c oxidase cbb3-type subunit 1
MNGPSSTKAQPLDSDTIVASGRWAFLGLFGGAALWLVVAGVLGLIASVKMHKPDLLADCAWFSYGRLKAASSGAFNFGFATQAAVAVALWLVAILGRATVKLPLVGIIAGKLWNLGVLLGVAGVLYGDSTGYEWLEFPRYSVGVLLLSFIGLALPVFVTFHNRSIRELYPSLWFVIAGLFWFTWLLTASYLQLHVAPVRGILQAAVQGWFANGFITVWLLPVAIAVLLYLRPLLSGESIASRATVLLGFWGLALVGPWGGIPADSPLPSWVSALSVAMSSLLLVPVLAIFSSVGGFKRSSSLDAFGVISWKLADFAFLALVLWAVLTAVNSFAPVYHVTQFTFVTSGLQALVVYGVAGAALLAAAFQILPKVTPASALCARVAGIQSFVMRVGVFVFVLAMLLAGQLQGRALASPETAFAEVTAASKMWFRVSTMGDLLLMLGGLVFFMYVAGTMFRALKVEWAACEWCHDPVAKPAEVAS